MTGLAVIEFFPDERTYWRVKYGMAKKAVDALTKATNMAERNSK
jgi:hypothetical protein